MFCSPATDSANWITLKEVYDTGPAINRHRPGNSVVGVDAEDREFVQPAVAFRELALRHDRLAFALFFGGDSDVDGDWH